MPNTSLYFLQLGDRSIAKTLSFSCRVFSPPHMCDTHRIITSTQNNAEGDKKKIAQMGSTIFTVASGVHDLYIVK